MENLNQETDNKERMKILLTEIAGIREVVKDNKETKAKMYDEFEMSHSGFTELMKTNQESQATLEEELRILALEEFERTKEKKMYGGVGIRMSPTIEYDPTKALDLAKERNMALLPTQLDKKAFEKIAKATKIDFVTIGEIPRATIPTKIEIEDDKTNSQDNLD